MCCFSQSVARVSGTRIFARRTDPGRQALAYSMQLSAATDLSMVLPLPVPPRSSEDAIRFVDLSGYPELFEDLQKCFPVSGGIPSFGAQSGAPVRLLAVHQVGAFEASFVPAIADFERLDPRFRLPDGVWDALPAVRDWGFAVFKLRAGEQQKVHPMAFEFPTRDARLFFPTVHVHDGEVHAEASFDHALYCQTDGWEPAGWARSFHPVAPRVDVSRTGGLVVGTAEVFTTSLFGTRPNEDVWVVA